MKVNFYQLRVTDIVMTEIILANESHLDELARLFNLYGIFYDQEDDYNSAYAFIRHRIIKKDWCSKHNFSISCRKSQR